MFDMNNLQNMLGDMQKNIKELEEKSKENVFTAKSGGGLLSVSVNGAGEVVDINIDDSLLDDKDALQILLISALNEAYKNMENNKKSLALNMLGGLNPFGS
ncbi:YbaB/EbfC family nucleoid-associated protein [Helicobacter sp.]|uniref:YbaB/EbfC family nucleoid-associated protein n=1 Tax=Helicobacter sp. TaxID=218 RepID=UPI0038905314